MGLIKSLLQVLRPPTPLTVLMISKSLSGLSRNDFQASLEEGGEDGLKKGASISAYAILGLPYYKYSMIWPKALF